MRALRPRRIVLCAAAGHEVVGRYPVARCKGNHGMALDPEHHRAFLSCEGGPLMQDDAIGQFGAGVKEQLPYRLSDASRIILRHEGVAASKDRVLNLRQPVL